LKKKRTEDLKIGNTSSAFIGQPISIVGTALRDNGNGLNCRGNVNADVLTRVVGRHSLTFVS
jgi:hypothetical protein